MQLVKPEKRPFWGLDSYLHFIILFLSIINLAQLVPKLNGYIFLNDLVSFFLSLFGLFTFLMAYRKYRYAHLFMLIWIIPQLISFYVYPYVNYDIVQGFSIPISYSHFSLQKIHGFAVNVMAILLILIWRFRVKNKFYLMNYAIRPIRINGLMEFGGKIIKSYDFDSQHKMLVLSYKKDNFYYAILVEKTDSLKFDNPTKRYDLCSLNPNNFSKESFPRYEFKLLGESNVLID